MNMTGIVAINQKKVKAERGGSPTLEGEAQTAEAAWE